VAICGLVGGSGCSTLAYSLAVRAARESKAPVLLTESGAHGGGLAVLTGQATPHSLSSLAEHVAASDAPAASFIELEPGLRLIAATPQRAQRPQPEPVRALLREARSAHGLVVIDCGSDLTTAAAVLAEATHIIWTLSARPVALARARVLFASAALPPAGRWGEALVVAALDHGPRTTVRALRRLTAHRCERVVLAPYTQALARGEPADTDERILRALGGLAPLLRTAT
jgi:MinD-like ATPase involved in chromosome partitioning or flagellar assembly